MIVVGDYNIYPKDIDEVLFQYEKIMEACAVWKILRRKLRDMNATKHESKA